MNVNNCQICGQPMSNTPGTLNLDCGGDCLCCMAWNGDPDAIEEVERLTGESFIADEYLKSFPKS